jgi:cytochrome c-type biogenesis protein CcmH
VHATGASRKILDETDNRSGNPCKGGPAPRAIALRPWGGVRTSLLSLVTLIALAAVIVIVLVKSLLPPEQTPPVGAGTSPEMSQPTPASNGAEIIGTITVARELTGHIREGSVLFVIARKAAGPPFAVKRIAAPRFPFAYRLGPEDVMMAGSAFDGEVRVSARLSRTGTAGPAQPGDLEGEHAARVRVGARNVDIAISREH